MVKYTEYQQNHSTVMHRRIMLAILEKLSSRIKMEPRLLILKDRRINFLSFCKFNISKVQDCCYDPKNCILKYRDISLKQQQKKFHFVKEGFRKSNLLLLTDSNNIHCSSSCKIFFCIIHSIEPIAVGLV